MNALKKHPLYWGMTILFCLTFLYSAWSNLVMVEEQRQTMTKLGFPLHLLPFLGVAKGLGILVLIWPGRPLLKEWAYAGFISTYSVRPMRTLLWVIPARQCRH